MSTLGAGAGPSTETAWRQLCDEEVSAFGVAHFVQPGGLDPSFDGDGVATAGFTGSTIAEDVLIQPDRKVVIAASVDPPGPGLDSQFAVARFTSTGALDPALGDGGRVVTDVSATGDYAYAVALQDDGRIVVAGSSVGDNPIDMLVARYLPNGLLDEKLRRRRQGDARLRRC